MITTKKYLVLLCALALLTPAFVSLASGTAYAQNAGNDIIDGGPGKDNIDGGPGDDDINGDESEG